MKPIFLRIAALAIALTAPPVIADEAPSQLYQAVSRDLPHYVKNVDMSLLSQSHLAAINNIINGSDSRGKKTALIKSIIRRSVAQSNSD